MEHTVSSERHIVESFFHQHPLMTLVSTTPEGVPQTAAVYIFFDQDMTGYLVSRESTRKFKNIAHNHTVVLSVHDEHVLIFGELTCRAEVLQDESVIAEVLPKLQNLVTSRKNNYWVPPVAQLEGDQYVFFKLMPQRALFVNYSTSESSDTKPHQIIIDF